MASIRDVREGLRILAKYAEPSRGSGATGEDVQIGGAGHDIICGPKVEEGMEMELQDYYDLGALGWHFDEECDCWALFC